MYAKYDKQTGQILGHYSLDIHTNMFDNDGLPLSDDMMLLTDDEWQLSVQGYIKIVDGKAVEFEPVISLVDLKVAKLEEIKQQISATDYKALKFAEGAMSVEEFEPIKIERSKLRKFYNEVEEAITIEELNALIAGGE